MLDFKQKDFYDVNDLREIVRLLRLPEGCPWDREQTHESIRRNFLEEAYEVAEAIDEGQVAHLKEELGDVLLQVAFHSCMEEEVGNFNLDDVADGVCKKLIFRHPHVFGDVTVSGTGEVLTNWEELKRQEKGQESYSDTVDSVANSLPALWRAEKIQKKAKKSGFDWDEVDGALDKLSEEVDELRMAVKDESNMEEELGDILFAAVNVSRFLHIDSEEALHKASDKFAKRFRLVEEKAMALGKSLDTMSLAEMDILWNEAKTEQKH